MTAPAHGVPDWDLEQLEVIIADRESWQLVRAGPGTGKTAVACQRVAFLVDEGVPPSRILLVSFTRTAVAELRDRIALYSEAGEGSRAVRISTLDSHAWSLRYGFDDQPFRVAIEEESYDLGIERAIELLRVGHPGLTDFLSSLEHVLVDEAQDIVGIRADFILELLRTLDERCGVTVLADPAQAIYGFTSDDDEGGEHVIGLLDRLGSESPRELTERELVNIHRIENPGLVDLFLNTRGEVESPGGVAEHVSRVQEVIQDAAGHEIDVSEYASLADFLEHADGESLLVLFRSRASVLFASSYCSNAGIDHRLRMSKLPTVVYPWLGWLFGESRKAIISQGDYERLWEERARAAPQPFVSHSRDQCWSLLHRFAAGSRPGTLDVVQLRSVLSRSRPPVEFCAPEPGLSGPILGTIHASKGREADTVVLVMSAPAKRSGTEGLREGAELEEGRVYYVGATRARKLLVTGRSRSARVSYLSSRRVYCRHGADRAQLEIGRSDDVDRVAHLAWSSAAEVQAVLARSCGITRRVTARSSPETKYFHRLQTAIKEEDGVTREYEIGELSSSFKADLAKLWGIMDEQERLWPAPEIRHLYLIGVTTVGLDERERRAVKEPYRSSGLALAPVVKAFSMIYFWRRKSATRGD